eukprot:3343211-Rhodomonas_salina.1
MCGTELAYGAAAYTQYVVLRKRRAVLSQRMALRAQERGDDAASHGPHAGALRYLPTLSAYATCLCGEIKCQTPQTAYNLYLGCGCVQLSSQRRFAVLSARCA